MSLANVEIVRRGIEATFRTPKPDFATMNDLYHADHVFVSALDALEGEEHHGARGYRDWRLSIEDAVEDEPKLEQVTEIDQNRVLAIMLTFVRGKSSGVVLKNERLAGIVTVRDGKIIRTEVYPSPEQALKAVGLAE